MDFQEIDRRLATVERALRRHGITVEESLTNVRQSPSATCVQCGVIVEHMLRDLWKRVGLKGSPDRRQLEDLVTLTTRKLEEDSTPMPASVLNTIRQIQGLRNQAAHHWDLKTEDAVYCLAKLADVAQWYFIDFLSEEETASQSAPVQQTDSTEPEAPESTEPEVLLLVDEPPAVLESPEVAEAADPPAPPPQSPAIDEEPPALVTTPPAVEQPPPAPPLDRPRPAIWLVACSALLLLSLIADDIVIFMAESPVSALILVFVTCPLGLIVLVQSLLRKTRCGLALSALAIITTLIFILFNAAISDLGSSNVILMKINLTLVLVPAGYLAYRTIRYAVSPRRPASWDPLPADTSGPHQRAGAFLLASAVFLLMGFLGTIFVVLRDHYPIAITIVPIAGVLGVIVFSESFALRTRWGMAFGLLPVIAVIVAIRGLFTFRSLRWFLPAPAIVVILLAGYLGYRTIRCALAMSRSPAGGELDVEGQRHRGRFLVSISVFLLLLVSASDVVVPLAEDLFFGLLLISIASVLGMIVFCEGLALKTRSGMAFGMLPLITAMIAVYANSAGTTEAEARRALEYTAAVLILPTLFLAYRTIRVAWATSRATAVEPSGSTPQRRELFLVASAICLILNLIFCDAAVFFEVGYISLPVILGSAGFVLGVVVFSESLALQTHWGMVLGLIPAITGLMTMLDGFALPSFGTEKIYRLILAYCSLGLVLSIYPAYRTIRFALAPRQRPV